MTEKVTTETETTIDTPEPVLEPDGPSTRVELPGPTVETTTETTTETTEPEPTPAG